MKSHVGRDIRIRMIQISNRYSTSQHEMTIDTHFLLFIFILRNESPTFNREGIVRNLQSIPKNQKTAQQGHMEIISRHINQHNRCEQSTWEIINTRPNETRRAHLKEAFIHRFFRLSELLPLMSECIIHSRALVKPHLMG